MATRKTKIMVSLRCVLILLAWVLAGCRSPASIYPVYQPKDLYVDDSILGTWTQCEDSDNPRFVISVEKCKSDPKAYDVEFWQEGKTEHSRSELRLTRIGQYSFADIEAPDSSEWSAPKTPGPIMPMHLFARVTIKPKAVLAMAPRVEALKHFAKKPAQKNEAVIKLVPIPHKEYQVDSLIVSPTEEVRQFLSEHSENRNIFDGFLFGRDQDACEIEAQELASAEAPDDAEIAYELALAYMRHGRFKDASAAWRRTPTLKQPDSFYALANAFMTAGKDEEALALVKSWVRATEECSIGRVYLEAGRSRDALARFAKCPDPLRSGIAYEQMGEFASARAEFNKMPRGVDRGIYAAGEFAQNNFEAVAQELQSDEWVSSHWLYFAMLHEGKKDEARRRLDSRFNVHLEDNGSDFRLGKLVTSYLRGEINEKALISAIKPVQNEQRCIAYFVIAEKHLLDGDRAGARNFFQKAVDTRAAATPEWIVSNARLKQLAGK